MIKIAILIPEALPVPSVKGGGVETLVNGFLDVNEKTHRADIDVFSIYDEEAKKESQKYKNTKFKFYKLHTTRFSNFFPRLLRKTINQMLVFDKRYFKKIVKDIEEKEYDYLIVENMVPLLPYLHRHFKHKNIKILVHIHNSDQVKPNFLVNLSSQCDGVLVVSNYLKKLVLTNYPQINNNKVRIIYNFPDMECNKQNFNDSFIKEFKNSHRISDDEKIILYSGRVIESKGIMELIKSIKTLENKKVDLLIIGNSWYGNSGKLTEFQRLLKKEAQSILGKVIFTGYIDHQYMGLYYSLSDICVFPSTGPEAAGLVQLESMRYKKMTIISNSGGMPEYMGSAGMIVNLGDGFQKRLNVALKRSIQMSKWELQCRGESLYKHSLQFNSNSSFDRLLDYMIGNAKYEEKKN